jgi:integration host factor subunit beta
LDLNKADLIDNVVGAVEITQKEAEQIVEVILGSMVRALSIGDKVEIRGFGSLHTRLRQGRIVRNPKTGARVNVPAKRIAFFKASKKVLRVLNG